MEGKKPKAPEDMALNIGAVMVAFGLAILGLGAIGWGFRGLTFLFGWELQPTLGFGLLGVGLLIVALRAAQGVPLSWLLREDLRPENRRAPKPTDSSDIHEH